MSNLIGPIDRLDWNTMLLLRKSVDYMKKEDIAKWSSTIEKEIEAYRYILDSYISKVFNDNTIDISKVA